MSKAKTNRDMACPICLKDGLGCMLFILVLIAMLHSLPGWPYVERALPRTVCVLLAVSIIFHVKVDEVNVHCHS